MWNGLRMPSELAPFLVIIVGPTAVGKTDIAIQVAERLNGEIISADSRLFYRGMDIGTAKPSLEERQNVSHHMIDIANPNETWSLALFQCEARRLVWDIWQRGRIPMLVGGTGQFIRAVTEEWSIPAQAPDETLRDALERWGRQIGAQQLHQKVAILDPEAASHIEPMNLRRSVRALEVIFLTGRLFSEQRTKKSSDFETCQIGLSRPRIELYERVDARIEKMIQDGLLDEVRHLLALGYSPDLPAFSAIGYREMISVLQGKISMEEAVVLMKRYTRQYIRRQANWFKPTDPAIYWFEVEPDSVDKITGSIQDKLEQYRIQ